MSGLKLTFQSGVGLKNQSKVRLCKLETTLQTCRFEEPAEGDVVRVGADLIIWCRVEEPVKGEVVRI